MLQPNTEGAIKIDPDARVDLSSGRSCPMNEWRYFVTYIPLFSVDYVRANKYIPSEPPGIGIFCHRAKGKSVGILSGKSDNTTWFSEKRISIFIKKVDYDSGVFFTVVILTDLRYLRLPGREGHLCTTVGATGCAFTAITRICESILLTWEEKWRRVLNELDLSVRVDVSYRKLNLLVALAYSAFENMLT